MKRPLWVYVIGVVVALAIVNYIIWLIHGEVGLVYMEAYSIGYLVGMLVMYIAVHFYRWK